MRWQADAQQECHGPKHALSNYKYFRSTMQIFRLSYFNVQIWFYFLIWSETSLWSALSACRLVCWSISHNFIMFKYDFIFSFEVKLLYNPVCPSVGLSVGLSNNFPKGAGSFTFMLLSEPLLYVMDTKYSKYLCDIQNMVFSYQQL